MLNDVWRKSLKIYMENYRIGINLSLILLLVLSALAAQLGV